MSKINKPRNGDLSMLLWWGVGRIKGLNSVPKERREKLEGGSLFFTLLFPSTSFFFFFGCAGSCCWDGSVAVGHRLSCSAAREIFLDRIETMAPALAGGPPALASRPPGKTFPVPLDPKWSNYFFGENPKLRRKCAFSSLCFSTLI